MTQLIPKDESFTAPDWLKTTFGAATHICPNYYFWMVGYDIQTSVIATGEGAIFPWRLNGPMYGLGWGDPFVPPNLPWPNSGDGAGMHMTKWSSATAATGYDQCCHLLREEDAFNLASLEIKGTWEVTSVGSAFFGSKTQGKKGSSPAPTGATRLPTTPSVTAATDETASLAVSPNLNTQTGGGGASSAFGSSSQYNGWTGNSLFMRAGGGKVETITYPVSWSSTEPQYYRVQECDGYALGVYPSGANLVAELWRMNAGASGVTVLLLAKQVVTGGVSGMRWDQPYTIRTTVSSVGSGNVTFTAFIGKYEQSGVTYDELQLFKSGVFTSDTITVGTSGDGAVNTTTGVVTDSGTLRITATVDKTIGFGMGPERQKDQGSISGTPGEIFSVVEKMWGLRVKNLGDGRVVYHDLFERISKSVNSGGAVGGVNRIVTGLFNTGTSLMGRFGSDTGGSFNAGIGNYKFRPSLLWTSALNDVTDPNDYATALFDPDTAFSVANSPADVTRWWGDNIPATQLYNQHRSVVVTGATGNSNEFRVGLFLHGRLGAYVSTDPLIICLAFVAIYTTDASGNQTSLTFFLQYVFGGSYFNWYNSNQYRRAYKVVQAPGAAIVTGFDMTSGSHTLELEVKTATEDPLGAQLLDAKFDGTAVTFDNFLNGAFSMPGSSTVTDPTPGVFPGTSGYGNNGDSEGFFFSSEDAQTASFGTFTPPRFSNFIELDLTPDPGSSSNPQANPDVATVGAGSSVLIDVLGNDQAFFSATLDPTTVVVITPPGTGTTAVNPVTGVIGYSAPPSTADSAVEFTYTVKDSNGLVSNGGLVSVAVTGLVAPLANDDFADVDAGSAVAISVLANDTAYGSATIVASTVAVVTAPGTGSTSVHAVTGVITFTAAASVSDSTVTFTYRFYDSKGIRSNDATVSVGVLGSGGAGGAPVANPDFASVNAGSAVAVDVLANDHALFGVTVDATTVAITSAPSAGSTSINASTGVITYTSVASTSNSTITFSYTFDDSGGTTSNAAVVTVSVVGLLNPLANPDFSNVSAGFSVAINVLSNDVAYSGATLDATSVAITVAATAGSTAVDGSTGVVTYTALDGVLDSTVTFSYTVDDSNGKTSNAAVVTINVAGVGNLAEDSIVVGGEGTASTNFSTALEAIDWSFSVEHFRPRYETSFESGHRYTSPKWGRGRRTLKGGAAGIPKTDMDAIVAFFNARKGAEQAFTFNFPVPTTIGTEVLTTMKVCFAYGGLTYRREAEGVYTAQIELTELL